MKTTFRFQKKLITFFIILASNLLNINAQNLTISTTGETGTSGTTWSITSNVLTITGNADVNASVISNHLASNNLSLSGVVNAYVNAAISWSSNTTLTLNASQNILIYSDITASGSSPQLYVYYGGSNASTAPNNTYTYALSQRNRNKINFSSSSAVFRVGNETYSVVTNLSQLTQAMSNATSSTRVALGASITLSQTYTNSLFPINFAGKFDGLGQVIDGLKIRNSGGSSVKANLGLFSQLQGATIRNLGITNIDILTNSTSAGTSGSEFRIGALAGNIGNSSLTTGYSASAYTTTIESVWSSGNISTANNYSSDGTSTGDRQKFFFAGGLVGSVNNGTANISRCYSYCNVSSSGSFSENLAIGGLIGDIGIVTAGTSSSELVVNLSKSFTTGSLLSGTFPGYYGTGGIIGVMYGSGSSVSDCYSWGSAISTGSFGGFIGWASGGSISTCYTTQSTGGDLTIATQTNNYISVTGTSPTSGTTLPTGFSNTVWSKASGELPVLLDLETPPTILYVRVTSGQSSTCGNLSINYTITDASGNAVTLSTLNLGNPTGTPVFTINNLTPPGTYSAVSYLSGLSLTGTNAGNYTLNPYPETTVSHTITGTCTNYQITFNGNGNTSGTAPANITFSGSTTIPNQGSLVNTGNTFLGWNDAANGSGTSYAAGATYSGTSNLTLYAQWITVSSLGCVSIVASGGAAENSGWVASYNTIRSSSSSAVNINASDLVTKLGSGNVKIMGDCITISSAISYTTNTKTLELEANTTIIQNDAITLSGPVSMIGGGDITINGNINTSTGNASGDILFKSAGDVLISSSRSITTNGGDVILWANSDGQTTNGGVFFDAQTSLTTNGGHLWIGGSSTSNGSITWNGLTVGNGYAVSGRNLVGLSTRTSFKVDWDAGILLNETSINTGGGNIYLGGQRNSLSNHSGGAGIINYNGTNGTTINAGSGTIDIKAFGSHTADVTIGFLTGLHPGETSGNLTIQSSNSNQAIAISIEANNASTNFPGLVVEDETNIISSSSTNGGGISITGITGGNNYGVMIQVGSLNTLSASGKITLDGGTKGIGLHVNSSFTNSSSQSISNTGYLYMGSRTGYAITSSNANIDIISDILNNNTGTSVNIASSGQLNILSKSNAFSQTLSTSQWNLSSNLSGLTIGKTTNTADITVGSSTTIAGPITAYGGNLTLNENLSSSNGGTISLYGNGLTIASGRTISSTGQLIVAPQTASTTIGLAGASGTLQLPDTYFSTNFTDGFSNIQIGSNSQTGDISSNAFTLSDNVTFLTSGSLTLGGIPVLGSNNVTLGSGISTISASASGYFQTTGSGTVNRNLANSASLLFPIGNAVYNPVTITNNTGSSDNFSAKVRDAVLEDGTTGISMRAPHVGVTWDINTNITNASPGINFTVQWESSQEKNSINSFALNHYNSSVSAWEFAAGNSGSVSVNGTTKTMTHTGYTGTFSPFAIGGDASPLPVQLLHFEATLQNKHALLSWSTSSETNNSGFEIMKSSDGQNWNPIGFVLGAGNSVETQVYQFVDFNFNTLAYYKLKQVDFDGNFSYSPIRMLHSNAGNGIADVKLYPNPNNGSFTVHVEDNATFELLDAKGARIQAGNVIQSRTFSQLAAGMYLLKLNCNGQVITNKIIVE